jgi:hypothetical protein
MEQTHLSETSLNIIRLQGFTPQKSSDLQLNEHTRYQQKKFASGKGRKNNSNWSIDTPQSHQAVLSVTNNNSDWGMITEWGQNDKL